jgi:Zn-finger domain-containing protein
VVGTEGRASPPTKKPRTNIELLSAIRKLDEILKDAAKKKNKRVPFKAVYCEVNGEIIYLLHDEEKDKFYKTLRDPQGRLHKQEETPLRGNPIATAQWGYQHTHIQFPRPKEYSLGEIGAPLDRTAVRQLTLEFSKNRRTPPRPPLRNGTKRC